MLSSPLLHHKQGPHQPSRRNSNKDRRLRKTEEFKVVQREGKSWMNALLVLRARANGMDPTRVGFSVSKRIGNAVVRNRVKRRLRELVRQMHIPDGWDIVFIARAPLAHATFQETRRAVEDLSGRAWPFRPSPARPSPDIEKAVQ